MAEQPTPPPIPTSSPPHHHNSLMAPPDPPTQSTTALKDKTFTTYTVSQSSAYQRSRPAYPQPLIDYILTYHGRTADVGGVGSSPPPPGTPFNCLLDVGCGPGTATRTFAPYFQHVHGCDASASMIETARQATSSSSSSSLSGSTPGIIYHVHAAERLESVPGIAWGSVDLIISAMAAHWFDLPAFYGGVARLLRPGGTLAVWTRAGLYCAPDTPDAEKVQRALDELELDVLVRGGYETEGNRVSRGAYADLPLPETDEFDADGFVRRVWGGGGGGGGGGGRTVEKEGGEQVMADMDPVTDSLMQTHIYTRTTLDELARGLGTASMVTRWREANAHRLHTGQVEDCVQVTVRRVKETLHGQDWLDCGGRVGLLMFKKKKQI